MERSARPAAATCHAVEYRSATRNTHRQRDTHRRAHRDRYAYRDSYCSPFAHAGGRRRTLRNAHRHSHICSIRSVDILLYGYARRHDVAIAHEWSRIAHAHSNPYGIADQRAHRHPHAIGDAHALADRRAHRNSRTLADRRTYCHQNTFANQDTLADQNTFANQDPIANQNIFANR